MNETLFAFALTSMKFLAPEANRQSDHAVKALVAVVETEEPLFKDDTEKFRTTALMIAVAFREGSLRPIVVGDCTESKPGEKCKGRPRSFCTLQIHETSGGSTALNEDPVLCFRAGFRLLKTSFRVCPSHPVAWYAEGGKSSCQSVRAQRISNDRMYLARQIFFRANEETASR
jgi:hypothetical protein